MDEHARAVDMIIRHGRCGEVYNIGSRNEVSNIALVRHILEILGRPDSLISYVPDRKGHDKRYAIDPGKISKELGFDAGKMSFDDTILSYAASFSKLADE